jgi:glycosyltransferase involved in cell wall biosynthesis
LFAVLRKIDLQASQSPDLYIANSREVQERITKYYKRDSILMYPPVDTEKYRAQSTSAAADKVSERSFYVITSALTPFKRVDIPIRVLSKLGIPLKIIGAGAQADELRELAGPSVELLGRLSDEEVAEVYKQAR